MKKLYTVIILFCGLQLPAQNVKILFDATKAEMAGNADWIIDADLNNIGTSTSGSMITGTSSFYTESNPSNLPTPAQSGISSGTSETYWTGALSAWAVDCAKRNYSVESLPYNDSITYGNMAHTRDLKHYTIFVVCEPNILFTMAEKKAIVQFVKDGGRLFIISDHTISDRNGDGYDSPDIWNDLFTNNSIQSNPFGITFDLQDYSQTTSNVASIANDTCLHGPMGNVTKMQFSGGTTMTLQTASNPSVKGLIFKTGASTTGTTNVFFARANYGLGRVCAIGDSSPMDDGTGDANDILYNGYTGDANGQHQLLLMNSMIWLAANSFALSTPTPFERMHCRIYPNPSQGEVKIESELNDEFELNVHSISGQLVQSLSFYKNCRLTILPKGFYLITLQNKLTAEKHTQRIVIE